jgi:hypothetical protein
VQFGPVHTSVRNDVSQATFANSVGVLTKHVWFLYYGVLKCSNVAAKTKRTGPVKRLRTVI